MQSKTNLHSKQINIKYVESHNSTKLPNKLNVQELWKLKLYRKIQTNLNPKLFIKTKLTLTCKIKA